MSILTSPTSQARAQSLPEFDAYKSYNYLDMNFGYGRGANLLDKSPFHSHGDITTASWVAGLHHYALDFNSATPDYVEIAASHTQLNFIADDFSFIARAYFDAIANDPYLFHRGQFQVDGYAFYVHNTGSLRVRTYQVGANQLTRSSAASVTTATWYTLGCSRSGTSIKIYLDGSEDTDSAASHTNPVTCARTPKIGAYDDKTTSTLDGKIEFFRIFGGIALPATAHAWFHNMLK